MRVISLWRNRILSTVLLLTVGIITTNCEKDPKEEPEPVLEENITVKVDKVVESLTSVTLTGTVTREKDAPKDAFTGIEYAGDIKFAESVRTNINEGTDGSFSITLEGLETNTTYYYRTYVCRDGKTYENGEADTFKTNAVTISATGIEVTETTLKVDGEVSEYPASTTFGITVSTSENIEAEGSIDAVITPDGDKKFSVTVENLTAGTEYWYGLYYKIGENKVYGNAEKVMTNDHAAAMVIDHISVTEGVAHFYCKVEWPSKDKESYEFGVQYATSSDYSDVKSIVVRENMTADENGCYMVQNASNELLYPSTKYYYRSYIKSSGAYSYGNASDFTTDNMQVVVKLDTYDESSATFSGILRQASWNFADKAITYGVLYSTSSSFDATTAGVGDITMTPGLSDDIMSFDFVLKPETATGLSANTTYYYRGYYKVNGNYTYLDIDSFTTPTATPKVSCDIASIKVIDGKVTFICDVAWPTENKENYEIGVEYSMNSDFSSSVSVKLSESTTDENNKYTVQNNGVLLPSTTYYYRTYVKNGSDVTYGTAANFTTDNMNLAFALDSFDETSATFSGAFGDGNWNYADEYISYGVLYSTNASFDATTSGVGDISLAYGFDYGSFSFILGPGKAEGLTSGTTYYYRGYYKTNGKYVYFDIDSFTTPAAAPKVSCDIASIKVIDGKVTFICDVAWPTENKENYEIGVEYSMNSDFSSSVSVKLSESTTDENNKYTVQNNGVLLPSTTYYYRTYVKNGSDVTYGTAANFTTDNMNLAFAVDSFDETSATFSGAFGDGNWNFADPSISYGVLYSSSSSFDATTAGVGDIVFSIGFDGFLNQILSPATATGLNPGTTYYYRGYYKVNGKYVYFDIASFTTK